MAQAYSCDEDVTRGGREGLQLFNSETNDWVLVPYDPEELIVNVGDCLEDWSGGRLKSARHRVVSGIDDACDRYVVALFVSPNYDTPITPSTTYDQWRKKRIQRAMKSR